MAPQPLKFPRNPVHPGDPFPKKTGGTAADWNDMDYEGWGNGSPVNERMAWVSDPLGSGEAVWAAWVQQGDTADHWGGCRAEVWREPHSTSGCRTGDRVWFAWSLLLTSADFKPPSGWALIWQVHTPVGSATLSPLLALDADGGKLKFRSVGDVPGGYNYGRRQYFLTEIYFHPTSGEFKAWCSLDTPPNPASAPTVQRLGYNTHPADGDGYSWPKLGPYRADGSSTTFPWKVFYGDGGGVYGLDLSRDSAITLAGWNTTPPPPTPTNRELVAAAKAELEQTTISGKKWVAGGRGPGHWRTAYELLDKITN